MCVVRISFFFLPFLTVKSYRDPIDTENTPRCVCVCREGAKVFDFVFEMCREAILCFLKNATGFFFVVVIQQRFICY